MASLQEIFKDERPEQRKKRLNKESQSCYQKKQRSEKTKYKTRINLIDRQYINITRHELGRMDQVCVHCDARFWIDEKDRNSS